MLSSIALTSALFLATIKGSKGEGPVPSFLDTLQVFLPGGRGTVNSEKFASRKGDALCFLP
jgi:hypothetical protein